MFKKNFVFLFILLLSSFFFAACSESTKTVVRPGDTITLPSESQNIVVTGIKLPGNYIELGKEEGVDLYYKIGASAEPAEASNPTLVYTVSDEKIATVDVNGLLTIKNFGEFYVDIYAEADNSIHQKVDFNIIERKSTAVDMVNNPLSLFGYYKISQYGINSQPSKNAPSNSSLLLSADKNRSGIIVTDLLINGAAADIKLNSNDMGSLSYGEISSNIFTQLNGEIVDNNVVIQLNLANCPVLAEYNILSSENDVLYLSLVKEYDVNTGAEAEINPVKVTEIQLEKTVDVDLKINNWYVVSPVIMPANATDKRVTYTSSDNETATVSSAGIVTAYKKGTVEITVESKDNPEIKNTIQLNIKDTAVHVTDIVFSEDNMTVVLDSPKKLEVTVLPDNATYKTVKFYSSDASIAEIGEDTGIVTAKRKGAVEITAVTDRGMFKKTTKVNSEVFSFPVTGILNVPAELYMAVGGTQQIKAEVFPKYATSQKIGYEVVEGSENVLVSEDGTITAIKEGIATLRVYAVDYPTVEKTTKIQVRAESTEIDVTGINITLPANLYIDVEKYNMTAAVEPANANINNILYAESSDSTKVAVYNNGNNSWEVVPSGEGSADITVYSKNGVKQTVTVNINKVMNIQGYYSIDKVDYTFGETVKTFTKEADKLQGEFAINVDNSTIGLTGRLQFTPAEPLKSYMFNNWRYLYINKSIVLDEADKYAKQTKDSLLSENVKVTGGKTIEYTYTTTDGLKAVIYLTKVTDLTKTIEDRTIFLTPVDMVNDPHSVEGYYTMTWFYGNSINDPWLERYPAIYSTTMDDMPTNSDIDITYHKECPELFGWAACYSGGGGANGSVTNYKGSFAVKVNGTGENAELSSIMKVQMQGHQNFNLSAWMKYIHGTFTPINLIQNGVSEGKAVNKNLSVNLVSNKGNEGSYGAYIAYTDLKNNLMQFEVQFKSDYKFMYKAEKVSDRYIDLPTEKYVSDDVSDRTPPAVPDLAVIKAVETLTGPVSDIE